MTGRSHCSRSTGSVSARQHLLRRMRQIELECDEFVLRWEGVVRRRSFVHLLQQFFKAIDMLRTEGALVRHPIDERPSSRAAPGSKHSSVPRAGETLMKVFRLSSRGAAAVCPG